MNHDRPILEVSLKRRIHVNLEIDVSLRMDGEIAVLFGPSGSGKTTVLRLISGLSRADSGTISLHGVRLTDVEAGVQVPLRRRRIGMIFQDDLLFPHLSVEANIRFGLKSRGLTTVEARERLAEVADLCGVDHLLARSPDSLSGGERQRVGLARATAPRPGLLLCDEPVSALDIPGKMALLERLRAIQRAEQIPILYVTHSPSEAVAVGTRLFLMEAGRIIADGPPLETLSARNRSTSLHLEGLVNTHQARVLDHPPEEGAARVAIESGPVLIVGHLTLSAGQPVLVQVRSDDIILARCPIPGLSARNRIPGVVEEIILHGQEAEIVVRTGGVTWIASVVIPAVTELGIARGQEVLLIIKSRSCRVEILNEPA